MIPIPRKKCKKSENNLVFGYKILSRKWICFYILYGILKSSKYRSFFQCQNFLIKIIIKTVLLMQKMNVFLCIFFKKMHVVLFLIIVGITMVAMKKLILMYAPCTYSQTFRRLCNQIVYKNREVFPCPVKLFFSSE